jgi:hypothetical protein
LRSVPTYDWGRPPATPHDYHAAETLHGEPIIKEGVNHLLLIRENGEWLIMAIAW